MITIAYFLDEEFEAFLTDNGLVLKKIDDTHYAIYNADYCLKIYDRLGHGYSVSVNIARTFNDKLYEHDQCSMYWAMKYFDMHESFAFSTRKQEEYENNLPLLIADLEKLIERLGKASELFWTEGIEWIEKQANK